MNQPRKLKIHAKFRSRKWDYITVPEIRLEGRWLAKLGFNQEEQVEVKQQRNKLVITLHKKRVPDIHHPE